MLTGIKTQLFQNFCSTYPMFCTRRLVLSIIITILLVILILLRKKNRTGRFLPIEFFIGILLYFRRIIKSPDSPQSELILIGLKNSTRLEH